MIGWYTLTLATILTSSRYWLYVHLTQVLPCLTKGASLLMNILVLVQYDWLVHTYLGNNINILEVLAVRPFYPGTSTFNTQRCLIWCLGQNISLKAMLFFFLGSVCMFILPHIRLSVKVSLFRHVRIVLSISKFDSYNN